MSAATADNATPLASFEIEVDLPQGKYRMNVELLHSDDANEVFSVSAGKRSCVLQSNRPQLQHSRKAISWKLLVFPRINPSEIAYTTFALHKVIVEIENYIYHKLPVRPPQVPKGATKAPAAPQPQDQLKLF